MRRRSQPKTLRTDASAALHRCAGWHMRLATRRISQFLERRLAPTGLSLPQFHLMCLIAAAEDDTLGALAERAGLDQSTLSRNLEGLSRSGWVEITLTQRDRRRRAAWLTEAGALKLEAAMPLWQAAQAELEGMIDAALTRELAGLAQGLSRGEDGSAR